MLINVLTEDPKRMLFAFLAILLHHWQTVNISQYCKQYVDGGSNRILANGFTRISILMQRYYCLPAIHFDIKTAASTTAASRIIYVDTVCPYVFFIIYLPQLHGAPWGPGYCTKDKQHDEVRTGLFSSGLVIHVRKQTDSGRIVNNVLA